ncbi:hypothetical protein ACNFU2_06545 [Chryseobacterium sp. PTM-20240506]|uniref:hypothetical protein n=1 Tax=Chryseobacterium sp. PTM-20240506 TaxID=3400631 RepID=UPI003AAB26CD
MKLLLKTKGRFATSFAIFFMLEILALSIVGYVEIFNNVIKDPAVIYSKGSNGQFFNISNFTNWVYLILGGFTFASILLFFCLGKYSTSKEE